MQTPLNTPSTFEAHPPHPTTTDRNVPHSPSDSGRDYTGAESPGHTTHGPDAPITTVQRDDRYEATGITDQPQHDLHEQKIEDENITEDIKPIETDYQETEHFEEHEKPVKLETEQVVKEEAEKPMEVEHPEEFDPQYQYDQNYEQPAVTGDDQYQNYQQQPYTEQQYENYEQYPQQAADPAAQYDEQYGNYATEDGNYPTEQNYDATQYAQELPSETAQSDSKNPQEQSYDTAQYAQEYQGDHNAQIPKEKVPESKNPQDKLPSQS